jgi:putative Mg2+ transporter-C (MgtC) family protein
MEFIQNLSWLDITLRVLAAIAIGLIIGIEREISNHPAGMKTHVLVCLGSALASIIAAEMGTSIYLYPGARVDLSRIASGVVSGMGFIGAGAIMKSRDGTMVTGITTAATLWATACMGLAVGMGYYRMAFIVLIAVFGTTVILKQIEKKFFSRLRTRRLELFIADKKTTIPLIDDFFGRKKITVLSFEYLLSGDHYTTSGERISRCRYMLKVPKGSSFNSIVRELALLDNVYEVYENFPGKEETEDQPVVEKTKSVILDKDD